MVSLASTLNSEICAIGLDVGGTKIAGGVVVRATGQVLIRQAIPTLPKRGGQSVLTDALALTQALMAEVQTLDLTLLGIGIGVCELVDPKGNVTSNNSFDWRGVPVQETSAQLAPAVVESDA